MPLRYCFVSGPQSWRDRYKVADGNLQSPINIETANAKDDNIVGPIKFLYESITNSTLTNDGRHLQVTLTRNKSGKQTTFRKNDFTKCHLLLLLHDEAIFKTKKKASTMSTI